VVERSLAVEADHHCISLHFRVEAGQTQTQHLPRAAAGMHLEDILLGIHLRAAAGMHLEDFRFGIHRRAAAAAGMHLEDFRFGIHLQFQDTEGVLH